MNDNVKKALIGIGGAIVSGLVTWAGLAARRAMQNLGRTELQIALDDLHDAEEEEKRARSTPGTDDDAKAAAHQAAAKKKVEKAKRLKALLDAAGAGDEGGESSERGPTDSGGKT